MPNIPRHGRHHSDGHAAKQRNWLIGIIAGLLILVGTVFLIILNLPNRLKQEDVDTSFQINDNAVQTESGLIYQDIIVGDGPAVKAGDTVSITYNGYLPDGQVFDSNTETGEFLEFILGSGAVIAGWDEGILGMRAGGARMLFIPAELALGAPDPFGAIPANTTLTYSITLREIR